MKTLVISTIIATATATTSFAQQIPNNYIGTNDAGVISERFGNDANTIITRDMATQNELDKTNGTVNLLTQEVRGRDKATNDRIDNLDADGKDAVAPLGALSFAAATATFSGNGMGFGLSASNYSAVEGSIVFGIDLGNNWRAVGGITTDFNNRHAATVGVGVSF